jgi:O-antigen ligase
MLMLTLRQHRPPKGIMIAAVTFSLICMGFLPEHYLDRLTALYDAAGSSSGPVVEDSLQGRISELYSGLLMFIDHPLFGVGLGNYPVDYQDYAQKLGIESRHSERHAHNMFLEWIAETGLFGGLILFALIKEMFNRLKLRHVDLLRLGDIDSARMLDAFRLGLWGYFIASLFLHAAFPRYFWLFSALAMAIPGPLIVAKFPLQLKAGLFGQPQSKP